MEASERQSNDATTADETPLEPVDVDHSTGSTTEPPKQQHDGGSVSVVSGMTDPASLEGQHMHLAEHQSLLQPMLVDVPKQVILPDENDVEEVASDTPETTEPLIVTTTPPSGDTGCTVSMSAMPDPPPALQVEASGPGPHTNSAEGAAAATAAAATAEAASEDGLDDYIRSPEVQNAIVERSPGGRYVRFMEKLGSGASKDVYRAYDTQEGIEVAWNVVNLSGVPKMERNRIVNEVRLLERLHHHNIISFHGSWVNRERQEVNFVTEILSSGTLKSFINKVQVIRWKIAKRWGFQILKGLEYLHSQDPPVIHRDLKCESIFINGTSGDLRIGDLGLSTVHRNGRVLSVLGTPEFMAPDMYEEHSYDEKVDIYAFGMCMLEIFTQEIPYSECNNPAQIYKKVSNGEPPEVLTRIQSHHAREFVKLCLGYKDENGKYVRPSASELLKHPFLDKRQNDDDEVVVEPPLRERAITEAAGESASTAPTSTPAVKRTPSANGASHQQQANQAIPSPAPPIRKRGPSMNSLDDEDGDQFEDMPQSETNMRKVKVMMGRGQEWKEEEDEPRVEDSVRSVDGSVMSSDTQTKNSATQASIQGEKVPTVTPGVTPQHSPPAKQHYLVAAAVIENEGPNVRPYADDILKLVVTLPVDGQTQNVQFDFHLVEDDPVQVAKEMVKELGIPQAAVLEISETISGLARAARMKQDKYTMRMRSAQNHMQPQHGQHGVAQPQHGVAQPQQVQGQGQMYDGPQEIPQNMSGQSPVPDYAAATTMPSAPQPHGIPEPGVPTQNQPGAQQPVYVQAAPYGQPYLPNDGQLQQQQQQVHPQVVQHQPPPHHAIHHQQIAPNLVVPGQQPHMQGHHLLPTQSQGIAPRQAAQSSPPMSQPAHAGQQAPVAQAPVAHTPAPALDQNVAGPVQGQASAPQRAAAPASTGQFSQTAATAQGQPSMPREGCGLPPAPPHTRNPPRQANSNPEINAPVASGLGNRAVSTGSSAILSSSSEPHVPRQIVNGDSGSSSFYDDESDSDDEGLSEELRKLDEDYQKNLQRANRVFHNRMDNLQRSQVEREAQHQKNLEKHEKERAEFEKRRAQEEEQQHKRMEQLQREWDERRQTLAQHKRKHHGHGHGPNGTKLLSRQVQGNGSHPKVENPEPPVAPSQPGHMRSALANPASVNQTQSQQQQPGHTRSVSSLSAARDSGQSTSLPTTTDHWQPQAQPQTGSSGR